MANTHNKLFQILRDDGFTQIDENEYRHEAGYQVFLLSDKDVYISYLHVINIYIGIDNGIVELKEIVIPQTENRCKGYGTLVMNFLINLLRRAEYKKIWGALSHVDDVDRLKNRFYPKFGFNIHEDDTDMIEMNLEL